MSFRCQLFFGLQGYEPKLEFPRVFFDIECIMNIQLCIDVPDFFSEGGSNRPPRISKFFFREGVKGVQGVNRILEGGGSPRGSF